MSQTPKHIAIILDGNGRWAVERKLPRYRGHMEGVKRLKMIVRAVQDKGIKYMTLYVFSTENWRRPRKEVSFLMKYFKSFLIREMTTFVKQKIRLLFIGDRESLNSDMKKIIDEAENKTRNNTGLTIVVAFNYGGREEILNAVRRIAHELPRDEKIDERVFEKYLYTAGIPDPDLLIRTSGEQRISNFLLWQISYAELYFTPLFWPDFTPEELDRALAEYGRRKRRFGGV